MAVPTGTLLETTGKVLLSVVGSHRHRRPESGVRGNPTASFQPTSNRPLHYRRRPGAPASPCLPTPPPPLHLQTIPPFTETTLTFPANQGTRRITVTTIDDDTAELTEQLSLRLSTPSANAAHRDQCCHRHPQ